MVLLVKSTLNFLAQNSLIKDVLDPNTHPIYFVGVRRANSPTGRADLALAQESLGDLVECAVVLSNQVSM